jgi:excisionase family DNA binding protein
MMDKEIVDVEGAATLLGVSTTTIYNLARKGEIPATRVGREWRFARANLIAWVANGSRGRSAECGVTPRPGGKEKVGAAGGMSTWGCLAISDVITSLHLGVELSWRSRGGS